MKVMIFDDNAQMREMMVCYMPVSSPKIRECDGSDALKLYEKPLPKWVLVNWRIKRVVRSQPDTL